MSLLRSQLARVGLPTTEPHTEPSSAYTLGTVACAASAGASPAASGVPGLPPGAKWRADQPFSRSAVMKLSTPRLVEGAAVSPGYGPLALVPWLNGPPRPYWVSPS